MLSTYRPLNLPSKSISAQIRDREFWNSSRSRDDADFYTIGYSGRKITLLIDILKSVGVLSIMDIRFTPISQYKPEFSKTKLQQTLHRNDIYYLHLPNLGIPRDIRSLAIDSNNRDVLWKWYDRYVVSSYVNGNLDNFLNTVIHPVAMLCTEISPLECHRHRLALALEKRGLRSYDL